jgi:hypothetical protein
LTATIARAPIEKRRRPLTRLIAHVDGVIFNEALAAEGSVAFKKACELGPPSDDVRACPSRMTALAARQRP